MIRRGVLADLPRITHVRTHVGENHLSVDQMAERGITQAGISHLMRTGDLACWVAEADTLIVAFSMADRRDGSIFALFTLPDYERRGYGAQLLKCCETWLGQQGIAEARLDTDHGTKAHRFYLSRGWKLSSEKHELPNEIYLTKILR
jgi:GNAT superfamily N-acetyltransferase